MRLIICYLYLFLFSISYCLGQGSFGKITSQPADFIRYGLTPVSYFSGKVNVEIPLYTLQDPDFSMPLSLSYTSDGLKPAKHPGLVGLDWVVNFGGVITREVYGAPDDANGHNGYDPASNSGYNMERGFWIASQERKFTAKQLLTFAPSVVECDSYSCYLPMTSGGYYYDAQPDLFLFRFPGTTGHFMIDNDGHIQSTDPELKIDISGLSVQYVENQYPRSSVIKITDGNGYVYSFGGDLSALEYRNDVKPGQNMPFKDRRSVIMAWHLVKIQAPNGRVMNFNYASGFVDRIDSPYWQASSSSDNTSWDRRTYSAVKGVYPASITIPDTGVSVEFSLSRETCRKFYLGFADYNYLSFQLSSLSVKQDSKEIYKYVFEYDNKQHLRFLKSVHMPDGGVYRMEYNHTTYPEPDTKHVDFWGYWSLDNSQGSGLLKKMVYPTGGYSEFLYEPHSYRERVETRVYINSFTPMLVEKEGVAGGFRVSQICNVDGKTQGKECRTFKYEDQSGRKSGILCQYPPYFINDQGNEVYVVSDIWYKNYNIEDQHVGYSNVKECFDDGSFIYYVYSDYRSNPDNPDVSLKQNTKASELSLVSCNVNRVTSASQERGRLLSKSFFQRDGSLSKRESYFYSDVGVNDEMLPLDPDYDRVPFDPGDYIVSFRSMEGGALAKKIYLKSYPLQASVERTSAPQGSVLRTKRYKYNRLNQLIEQKDYCSDGSTLKHTYAYPNERTSLEVSNVYNRMVAANMINKPVEETTFRNTRRLASSRTTYRMHGSLPVKDSIMQSFRNEPYQFMTAYPYYDSFGHALFEVNRDGTRTIRLWGYNCRYLVAEIRNIPETNMNTVWSIIRPERFSFSSSPDFSFVEVLRSSYPDIQVYLYTYSPLVGVLSVTSPNGKVTNFRYDAAGRLVEKTDHVGHVESKYEYNYMPY
ncbi:RHS repeat domain-containing protein [Bacteroides salyersiae]|uniref:RHS repeat domain-containing protein n=1 Tax=Bacteroides salyersiae TaxID=291644 RepID=UPI00221F6709|nr:RHS repeat domain-containing protein [Bacteroides salyersiae]UYU40888.1 RHS repeat protein [Bacteroides salyersiae]